MNTGENVGQWWMDLLSEVLWVSLYLSQAGDCLGKHLSPGDGLYEGTGHLDTMRLDCHGLGLVQWSNLRIWMWSLVVLLVRGPQHLHGELYAKGFGRDEKICPTSVLPLQITGYQHLLLMSIPSAPGGMHLRRSIYNWWINEKSSLLQKHGWPFLLKD